jgi:alkylhydroperoxidase/carboxymuconolactone decarboxylase family protein YurZ
VPEEKEFFNVKYKEGSLDPKTAQLILFAVCMSHGYENGAKLHLGKARECGATDDEILEAVVYGMRPPAALARNVARNLSVKGC